MPWYTPLDTNNLVERLQKANWAYHNTDKYLMTDDEFDLGLEELRRRSPSHPFLSVIGAPVSKGCVVLPVCMGSQDKVRAGEGALVRWLRRDGGAARVKNFIVSEKLDGLSALFVLKGGKKSLYLRGDGVKGVDCSAALGRGLALPLAGRDMIIRGELLLRKADTPAGSIGRSIVNGWMHRAIEPGSKLPAEFAAVRFVAYQVVEPAGLTRGAQMTWLTENGFETPWWGSWPAEKITEETLTRGLIERKTMGAYPLDGLVVATDAVPVGLGGGEAKNPPDSVAFKVSLDDQKAETRIVDVVWTASRLNVWIPRIQIEPVEIGGATIQWLSGHNAALIADNGLGAGARIVVRRSGDVIPALDEVLERCSGGTWSAPPEGQWEWDANHVHAVATVDASADKIILHALQTLGVEGIGPGLVAKLVEKGFDTMIKIWTAKLAGLSQAIGGGRAPAFMKSLRDRLAAATHMTLLIASNRLPRGVGERKLRILFDKESDPKKWGRAFTTVPDGWSADSLKTLLNSLPAALGWIEESFPGAVVAAAVPAAEVKTPEKYVVFTGVRDKELEGILGAAGWAMQDAVSSKTSALVVADGEFKESGKTKKAVALGVKIMKLSEFRTLFGATR